jgi:hypothetical protein
VSFITKESFAHKKRSNDVVAFEVRRLHAPQSERETPPRRNYSSYQREHFISQRREDSSPRGSSSHRRERSPLHHREHSHSQRRGHSPSHHREHSHSQRRGHSPSHHREHSHSQRREHSLHRRRYSPPRRHSPPPMDSLLVAGPPLSGTRTVPYDPRFPEPSHPPSMSNAPTDPRLSKPVPSHPPSMSNAPTDPRLSKPIPSHPPSMSNAPTDPRLSQPVPSRPPSVSSAPTDPNRTSSPAHLLSDPRLLPESSQRPSASRAAQPHRPTDPRSPPSANGTGAAGRKRRRAGEADEEGGGDLTPPTPPPALGTNRTRRVLLPVLIGHAAHTPGVLAAWKSLPGGGRLPARGELSRMACLRLLPLLWSGRVALPRPFAACEAACVPARLSCPPPRPCEQTPVRTRLPPFACKTRGQSPCCASSPLASAHAVYSRGDDSARRIEARTPPRRAGSGTGSARAARRARLTAAGALLAERHGPWRAAPPLRERRSGGCRGGGAPRPPGSPRRAAGSDLGRPSDPRKPRAPSGGAAEWPRQLRPLPALLAPVRALRPARRHRCRRCAQPDRASPSARGARRIQPALACVLLQDPRRELCLFLEKLRRGCAAFGTGESQKASPGLPVRPPTHTPAH